MRLPARCDSPAFIHTPPANARQDRSPRPLAKVAKATFLADGRGGGQNVFMVAPDDAVVSAGTDEGLVEVVFLKYDGRPHRSYPARLLGEDVHGVWLGVVAGTPALVDGDRQAVREEPYVLLVPRDGWWTAMFNAPPRNTEIYCDITTPATWAGTQEVTVIDLDLDVRRRRWGVIERLDEDEFRHHADVFGYPPEVRREAMAASLWLAAALGDGTEPFAADFRPWLAQVTG